MSTFKNMRIPQTKEDSHESYILFIYYYFFIVYRCRNKLNLIWEVTIDQIKDHKPASVRSKKNAIKQTFTESGEF